MARIAKGVIEFTYDVDEYEQNVNGVSDMSLDELVEFFTDSMVDDVIEMRYGDIKPAIEVEIVDEYGQRLFDENISWGELAELTHATQVERFGWCPCEDNEGNENPYGDCPSNNNYTWEIPWNDEDPYKNSFGEMTTAMITNYKGEAVVYCHISKVWDILEGLRKGRL